MARKKKSEPFVGIGKDPDNNLVVQKSRPLTALWQSGLTLPEFKLLDTYLARIDSRKPEKRTVIFEKGDVERCLGLKQIKPEDLKARIKNLGQGIDVPDENKPGKFKTYWLFEEAECDPGEDGVWTVKLTCNEKARQYFFNVEKIGYLRYKLRCITSLQSRYTYILFTYLENNRFRGTWEVDLDELKQLLNCHTEETYKEFKRFNDLILKKCQKELNEKTYCNFTYETIRKGRSISAIRFKLKPLSPQLEAELNGDRSGEPAQPTIDDHEFRTNREAICSGFGDKIFDEFSDEELVELKNLARGKEDPDEVERKNGLLHNTKVATEYAMSKLIHEKILAMNVYAQREPIPNRYGYLKAAVANHIPKPKAKKSKGSFETEEFFAAAVKRSMGDDFDPEILNQ